MPLALVVCRHTHRAAYTYAHMPPTQMGTDAHTTGEGSTVSGALWCEGASGMSQMPTPPRPAASSKLRQESPACKRVPPEAWTCPAPWA